jgi:hypothetical protein
LAIQGEKELNQLQLTAKDMDMIEMKAKLVNADKADYAPTQILAEVFRGMGCDGIRYRSCWERAVILSHCST